MKNEIDNKGLEKSVPHTVVEIIEYVSKSVVTKTILKKITGSITVSSFAAGEEQNGRVSPFEIYVQILDGSADVKIDNRKYHLGQGEGMLIPAHVKHDFSAGEQFKMISTIIKSGYED